MPQTQPEETAVPAAVERKIYAAWKCLDCGVIRAGYIHPFDYTPRRCLGIPRTRRTDGGRICGGRMTTVYRESA